jgi:alpha-tubulin suppressor-like RCC1 family protein
MTTDYNIDKVDLDESPYNFSSYINQSDGNYTNASIINVTARKTVIFGQNVLTNTYPIGNLGGAFDTQQGVNIPKIDIDKVTVIDTLPTGAVFSDTRYSQNYIRGNFSLLENDANRLVVSSFTPLQVGTLSTWTQINAGSYNSMALQNTPSKGLWIWGDNGQGGLGLGDLTNRSSPVQIGLLSAWIKVSSGNQSSTAIQSNGTLWAWGENRFYGQLGLSNLTSRSTPVQVGSSLWKLVSIKSDSTLAIQTNGTLWSWGYNGYGQLGLSDAANRSSPVQVGALSTWSQISAGGYHSAAIQSNGTLWTWGRGNEGALGLSDTISRSSPTQVGSLSIWTQVTNSSVPFSIFSCAIQSDGTLWSWGNNSFGQLGLSDLTNRSSPVQVGALSVWIQVSAGSQYSLAIQSNGTLWAWGNNSIGQLGLSDQTHRSSPVQVGNLSNWLKISTGDTHSVAIQSDGTLWAWGSNGSGQLGLEQTYTQPYKITYGL